MSGGKRSLWEEFLRTGRAAGCPVYDFHGHMGPFYGIHFPAPDADSMVRAMDRAGVKLLAFCHHGALFCPEIGNRANIEAVRRHPDRLRAYCGINPNYPEFAARDVGDFDRHRDVYIGFKFLADYHAHPITGPGYRAAWEFADANRLLVLLHTWGNSEYDGWQRVREAAGKYSGAKILLGHSCHGAWDQAVALAKDFPNIYLELCAVMDDRGVLEKFVAGAGSRRILFGTDMPWFNYHYYIGAVLGAEITEEDRRNILYRNGRELLLGKLGTGT